MFQVSAIDQDTGVNDDIIYSIESKPQQPGDVKTICFGIKESFLIKKIFTLFDRFISRWPVYNLKRSWRHICVVRN